MRHAPCTMNHRGVDRDRCLTRQAPRSLPASLPPCISRYLAAFLQTVGPAARFHVNLIPYNAQSRPSYETPTPQAAWTHRVAGLDA